RDRKRHAEIGAPWTGLHVDDALVVNHETAHEVKPLSCTLPHRLGREKGFVHVLLNLRRDPRAVVDDMYDGAFAFTAGGDVDVAALPHGVERAVDHARPHVAQLAHDT